MCGISSNVARTEFHNLTEVEFHNTQQVISTNFASVGSEILLFQYPEERIEFIWASVKRIFRDVVWRTNKILLVIASNMPLRQRKFWRQVVRRNIVESAERRNAAWQVYDFN